jgi:hypothetical protein
MTHLAGKNAYPTGRTAACLPRGARNAGQQPAEKGTGSEPVSENAAKNNAREVPIPFFQQTAKYGKAAGEKA